MSAESCFLTILIALTLFPIRASAEENNGEKANVGTLGELSTNDLIHRLSEAEWSAFGMVFTGNENIPNHPEAFLRELLRRNDADLKSVLRSVEQSAERLEKKRESRDPFNAEAKDRLPTFFVSAQEQSIKIPNRAEVQIAIRRLQGHPDPLEIEIAGSEEVIPSQVRLLPTLNVAIRNVDVEQTPVHFKFGGDYRSGRLARWRMSAVDSEGIPVAVWPRRFGMGGGVCSVGELKFGESYDAKLRVSDYLKIEKPGRYKLILLYHNEETIADVESTQALENFIFIQSEPFWFEVQDGPFINIELTKAQYDQSLKLLKDIGIESFVFVNASHYAQDESLSDFISPESRHGKLLKMKEQAVPAILSYLSHDGESLRDRAFVLQLLYSIIPEPGFAATEHDGVMPSYTCRFPGGHCSSSGTLDEKNPEPQRVLTEKWMAFAKHYIRVKRIPDE